MELKNLILTLSLILTTILSYSQTSIGPLIGYRYAHVVKSDYLIDFSKTHSKYLFTTNAFNLGLEQINI